MDYTADEFLTLAEAIEAQGGALSPDACVGENLIYEIKSLAGVQRIPASTAACGNEAIFVIPYAPGAPVNIHKVTQDRPTPQNAQAQIERGAGFARVCAVDDAVALWPRFIGELL